MIDGKLFPAGFDDAPALLAPGRPPLTYAALRSQVARTAAALRSMGIRRHDRVAMVLSDGPEMASAFLAVSAVAAAAPLNPRYVEAELEFYLDDLQPALVLIEAGKDGPVRELAKRRGLQVAEISFSTADAAGLFVLDGQPGVVSDVTPASDDDVVLVLHTSGTTARPKRVSLRRGQVRASVRNVAAALQLSTTDRGLHLMPLFHVHGLVAGLLAPLHAGGSVYCTPGMNIERFPNWLKEARPTWFTAVPTMHQAILAWARQNPDEARAAQLKFIRSCSAALAESVASALEEAFDAPVVEAYAMTEAAHQMTCNPLPPGRRRHGSVGVAAGPEVAILDSSNNLLAAGQTGEVAVRGENVFAGYDENPEANAASFSRGWFRTGDLGRLDDDGYLWLQGRLKEMINRGGEKISPLEVESHLLAHPSLAEAVVFAMPHQLLGEEVGAAVVLREGAAAKSAELQSWLVDRISLPKIPKRIVFLPALPKGPTGKLRRIGLAASLDLDALERTRPVFVAPRSPSEEALVAIWSRALGVPDIGIHDNFFDLGGDSLAALRIADEMLTRMKAEISLTQFLEAPTIADVAVLLTEARLREMETASMERLLAQIEEDREGASS